ncbi:MAG TPA: AAA family ATPase [Bryobacteraceae bacterium]|nr:AAA family ATPase [Bryobacteraceae bacterium]
MADGITRIAVEGFKSIAKRQEIEIAPLTILAGANSSGKSSIMQPLLLLKQTLEAPYDPGPLKIDGPNVIFTSAKEFLSSQNETQKLGVEIPFRGDTIALAFEKTTPTSMLDVLEQRWTHDGRPYTLRSDSPGVARDRCFLRPETGNDVSARLEAAVRAGGPPISFLQQLIQKLIHVPGLRSTRGRQYPAASTGPMFPGTFDYYHASVIRQWWKEDPNGPQQLEDDLSHMGLARMVLAKPISEVAIELYVALEDCPRRIDNIADVGFGVSQALPVLVALRAAEPGRLVYLEEPEIHLHPRAVTKLADILAGAAKRGVRVVAETHSALLLRAIQTLVAKGDLDPNQVRLHWFNRDASGVTSVSSATPDANGAFGDWPEDFGDVALRSEQEYLDAVEGRLTR